MIAARRPRRPPAPTGVPRAKRRDLESPVQAAIVELIRVGYPDCIVHSIPNGGFILDPRTVSKLKWTGLLPGMPDLGLDWTSDHGYIETKSEDGALSAEQVAVHKLLMERGHKVAVCHSVADARNVLELWGVPSRIVTGLAA